jgi:hypothetical protein
MTRNECVDYVIVITAIGALNVVNDPLSQSDFISFIKKRPKWSIRTFQMRYANLRKTFWHLSWCSIVADANLLLTKRITLHGVKKDFSSSTEVKEWVELYLHSPNTPSWCGAQLKHRDNFTFYLCISLNSHHIDRCLKKTWHYWGPYFT